MLTTAKVGGGGGAGGGGGGGIFSLSLQLFFYSFTPDGENTQNPLNQILPKYPHKQ